MFEVELSTGTIEYEDIGGECPVLIFLHGLTMDGSLWRHVVPKLRPTSAACYRHFRSGDTGSR
jgi:pimeloyl-ACP methyl ester carboxylesterase